MFKINGESQIPEERDVVSEVVRNESPEDTSTKHGKIIFESGKILHFEYFPSKSVDNISDETLDMIEKGVEEMEKGNTVKVNMEEDFPGLFDESEENVENDNL